MRFKSIDADSCSCEKLLKTIEENYIIASNVKNEIIRLQDDNSKGDMSNNFSDVSCSIDDTHLDGNIDSKEIDDFEDEVMFYLKDYNKLSDDFSEQDLLDVLPVNSYNFHEIVYRLKAESYKAIKEYYDWFSNDKELSVPEKKELKKLIELERKKISVLTELMKTKEADVKKENIQNELILLPTSGGNIKIIEDLKRVPREFDGEVLDLINSIVNGTFKRVKRFVDSDSLCEVRGGKIRVVFSRVAKNTYVLVSTFIKKVDKDNKYMDSLSQMDAAYRNLESFIKNNVDNEEFRKENDLNVDLLFDKLGAKNKNKKYLKGD